MFNLDTDALTAQIAVKSTAEKKVFREYVNEYYGLMCSGCDFSDTAFSDLCDHMVADPDISVQTFVAFFLFTIM